MDPLLAVGPGLGKLFDWRAAINGPQWVLKFDGAAGVGPDGRSVLVTHLIGS